MPGPTSDPVIVVTNPGEDCSTEAFAAFLAEMAGRAEPQVESIGRAEALAGLRCDTITGAGRRLRGGRRRGR